MAFEIEAGVIDLRLSHAPEPLVTSLGALDVSVLRPIDDHQKICNLIDRLQRTQRIRTQCRLVGVDILRIGIILGVDDDPNFTAEFGPLGRHLLELLQWIDCRPQLWASDSVASTPGQSVFEGRHKVKSLLDIFVGLPSPASVECATSNDVQTTEFLRTCLSQPCPGGMKTHLYNYQKASIWKILQRELAPESIQCPNVVKLVDIHGTNYYFDQLTTAVSTTPFFMTDVAGGIICEDMGTGKTCICLATVMATLHHPYTVNSLGRRIQSDMLKLASHPLYSLRDMTAFKVVRSETNWRLYKDRLGPDVIELMNKYPAYYEWTDVPYSVYERPHRHPIHIPVMKVYTSHATLAIVPDNLVLQWTSEIYKHIHDGELNFLAMGSDIKKKNQKQDFPSPIALSRYDMVIISQTVFAREYEAGGFSFEGARRICSCPYIGATRQRNCICPPLTESQAYISPLLQVHWKRMIVDEGHRLSSPNRMSELSAKLLSNWKWICTGTPTQNLTESTTVHTNPDDQGDDMMRLGTMLGNTLNLLPFTKRGLWGRLIAKPFMDGKPWAIENLTRILTQTMIRNQRSNIEQEIVLPPLYHKQVYLDFDYYQWMAHNCQIAMIGLNAILSKREGPDYLFSPNNTKALRETVHNLWQSCLWHSVDLQWLQASYQNCLEKIEEVNSGRDSYGKKDTASLLKIESVLKNALNDSMFMQMMSKHAPSFLVQGLPSLMQEKWGWLEGNHGVYSFPKAPQPWDDYCIMGGDIVVDLMRDVINPTNDSKDIYVYDAAKGTLTSTDKGKNKSKINKKEEPEKDASMMTYYTRNAFSDGRILCSTSSKINYLVDQIAKHHTTEKCIIFSQHYNEMQEIYLALELVKVRTLMYLDTQTTNASRSQTIMTFNTSENANVIIMAVQRAAYGIDLSAASRVYFVSPVWQKAMEQQAIKRAHRIGQTRPVHVETLVIRHSIEDALLNRREVVLLHQKETQEYVHQSDFFKDKKLQNTLCHATFVPLPKHITILGDGTYHQLIKTFHETLFFVPPERDEAVKFKPEVVIDKKDLIDIDSHIEDEDEEPETIKAELPNSPISDPAKRVAQQDGETNESKKRVRFAS